MVLTLFAFVDLGIAEVMERLQLRLYARPTRYASLVLPILPLVQLIGTGGLTDITVFHLVAAGTFYAVACGTMQWKTLGYAAGVLYNAALWVLWGPMGWQLADHPQFLPRAGGAVGDPLRRGQPRRAGPGDWSTRSARPA